MAHATRPFAAAALLCGASTLVHADLVYETRFELQTDGSLVTLTLPSVDAYRVFWEDAIELYEPLRVHKRKFAEAMEQQREQELHRGENPDGIGNFGGVGDDVAFNPLATGGTAEIATGGEFIDQQLSGAGIVMEIARVDVDNEVFRQEFGPVRVTKRESFGGPDIFTFEWQALHAWDTTLLDTDSFGLTDELRITWSVVPAPGVPAVGIATVSLLGARRRRG